MKRIILHVFDIKASLDKVIAALSSIEGLSNWWTTDVSGSTLEGSVINFRFATVFKPDMKVIESSTSYIEWQCVGGEQEWMGDKFTFFIDATANNIKLTFTQNYVNEISDEQYGRFNFNWGYYLNSLKQYCETGKGVPFSIKN